MERTNYVAKAKSLMMSTVRTTALVIIPLAAAVNAQGGPIISGAVALPIGNFACSYSDLSLDSSGSCSGGDSQQTSLGSGVQGMSFFTTGSVFLGLSGGGGELILTMTDHGTVGGAIPAGTAIPVGGLFSITAQSGASITSWSLSFDLGTSSGSGAYGSVSGGGTSGGSSLDPSLTLNVSPTIPGSSTLWETASLIVFANSSSGGGGDVAISVPGGTTWDFNSVAASSVPEPASLGLIGSGLALLGALVRRRRKK